MPQGFEKAGVVGAVDGRLDENDALEVDGCFEGEGLLHREGGWAVYGAKRERKAGGI